MKLSVIIPSYNRLESLKLCLASLGRQTLPREAFEVIVVDDGSGVDYQEADISRILSGHRLSGRYFRQENAGPGAARNRGVSLAAGEVVVFIGDDMLGKEDLLQLHYDFHVQNPGEDQACLGRVAWPPAWEQTVFMRWLDTTGFQFDFLSLKAGELADYKHFYTSNISLKRNFLLNNGLFDESFPYAAFEDTELGYRLAKKGLRLVYEPKCLVYHHHRLVLSDYLSRMEKAGESAAILSRLHPELEKEFFPRSGFSGRLKDFIKGLLFLAGAVVRQPRWQRYYYRPMLLKRYLRGYERAKKNIHHHS